MRTPATPWNDPRHFQLGVKCPYYDDARSVCSASFSGMPVQRARKRLYCQADEHDSCAMYLSKMLRNSQSKNAGMGARELCCK
jgi:hypothetical protein